ncbi:MAG: hypothetical protein HY563_01305 [Ignavibacteriales bacterium]|nr:hypothetical protein [Ignavibacteriales bacterium]
MNEFRFYSKLDLTVLLGRRAKNSRQLLEGLRHVPDASIYFHTHKFLLQYHYVTPVPPNDFAQWALLSLNDDLLGERLSSIDVVQYGNLGDLRASIMKVVEEHVEANGSRRECPPGEEFHFMASQAFIVPTPIVVHTLQEFAAHLEHVSLNSLYHHMFDARLRLGRGENDFSAWFRGIGKPELAEEVKKLDPYLHTLEGLRKRLAVLVRRYA